MAQKIIIEESSPADQWPKAYGMDTKTPGGVEFFIGLSLQGTIFMAKESNPAPIEWQRKPDWWNFEYGIRLGFDSFKSAIEWWLNPQPIEQPKPLTFADLAIGDYFVIDDGVFNPTVELKISNEFSTITSWNSIQIFPTSGQRTAFAHDASVTAFRGTIEVKGKE